jgi:hypothetical protein
MVSGDDEPDSRSDDAQEASAPSEHDFVLEDSTDNAKPVTPHSNSHDEVSQPRRILQHRPKESPGKDAGAEPIQDSGEITMKKFIIEVRVPPPERPWEYLRIPEEDIVEAVLEEVEHPSNDLWYKVAFVDGREKEVSDMSLRLRTCSQASSNPAV